MKVLLITPSTINIYSTDLSRKARITYRWPPNSRTTGNPVSTMDVRLHLANASYVAIFPYSEANSVSGVCNGHDLRAAT